MEPKTNQSKNINQSHFGDCIVLDGQSLYFISDIHLTGRQDPKLKILQSFVNKLASNSEKVALIILGDLFDFWVADHEFLKTEYANLIDTFRDFVSKGNKLVYFEGNHDLHLKNFWQSQVGAKVFTGPVIMECDGNTLGVEHGDQMDPEDKGYIRLRWFLRLLPVKALIHLLPGFLVKILGEAASRKSRKYTDRTRVQREKDFAKVINLHLDKISKINPIDAHVSGHVHQFIDESMTIGPKSVKVVNLGWWYDKPRALRFGSGQFRILEL